MYKSQAKKKAQIMGLIDGIGRPGGQNKELTEKLNSKKLPEHVKNEIQKEMKRMGGESQRAVTEKYV